LQNILKGLWRAGPQNKGNSPSILVPGPKEANDGSQSSLQLAFTMATPPALYHLSFCINQLLNEINNKSLYVTC
jgi:hypothetical protein